jgi:hypothetical protein|tara:strand:- start:21949 stop:22311 length:363 start_codon:yes stop_codon:yes gene_type:complete
VRFFATKYIWDSSFAAGGGHLRKAFEVKHPVDIERLRIFMTQSGFVALDCEDMSAEENARLFGDDGVCEPVALQALVRELLAMQAAASGEADAAAMSRLADSLQCCLDDVGAALASQRGA